MRACWCGARFVQRHPRHADSARQRPEPSERRTHFLPVHRSADHAPGTRPCRNVQHLGLCFSAHRIEQDSCCARRNACAAGCTGSARSDWRCPGATKYTSDRLSPLYEMNRMTYPCTRFSTPYVGCIVGSTFCYEEPVERKLPAERSLEERTHGKAG